MKIPIRTKIVALILFILLIAIGSISYRSLTFFQQDKETYVYDLVSQVVSMQSQEIDKKLISLRRMLEIFDDFAGFRLSVAEREKTLKKFEDFLFISTFHYRGGRLVDDFGIANKVALSGVGLFSSQIKNQKEILKRLKRNETFQAVNLTVKGSNPVVALILKPNARRVVLGVLPQNKVLDISSTKKVYNAYLVDLNGELIMHPSGSELLKRPNLSDNAMVASWQKNPKFPITREYDFAEGQKILGAYSGLTSMNAGIFVEVPREQAFVAARRLIQASSLWAILIFVLSCILGIIFAYQLTRPLKALGNLTKKIAKGDFTVKAEVRSNDELGDLVQSFNQMSTELDIRDKKLEETHRQLVQGEKMSAFGQMSAGIAHEVKNPLAGILGYAQLAKRKIEPESPVIKYVDIIEKETKRCKEIIENLMKFARQETSTFTPINFNQTVKDAITLVDHQISIAGIKIVQELEEDERVPQVVGNANQIQQVLMNLMLNAQHAMEDKGTLTIRTTGNDGKKAIVQIADTGHGISEENQKKIFEPFFTTKEAGKGTGLGLAVSYGIIKDHRGNIEVDSEINKGTTFTITLPAVGTPEAPPVFEAKKEQEADKKQEEQKTGSEAT